MYISQSFTLVAFSVIGLCIGSFLNVVIYRLPKILEAQFEQEMGAGESESKVIAPPEPGLTLSNPPSRCGHCGHRIRWFENIPVLSFIWLRGKCSSCGTAIGLRYPLIEVATAVIFFYCAWRWHLSMTAVGYALFGAAMLTLSMIDWDTTYLPQEITSPLIWGGMIAAGLGYLPTVTLHQSLAGAVVGYLSLWGLYWIFKYLTGREGLGWGDFSLLAAIGAWLGWASILPVLWLASVMGIALAMLSMSRQGVHKDEAGHKIFPFGPSLALAAAVDVAVGSDWFNRLIELIFGT